MWHNLLNILLYSTLGFKIGVISLSLWPNIVSISEKDWLTKYAVHQHGILTTIHSQNAHDYFYFSQTVGLYSFIDDEKSILTNVGVPFMYGLKICYFYTMKCHTSAWLKICLHPV